MSRRDRHSDSKELRPVDDTVGDLLRFSFERLPKPAAPYNDRPCLAEDWFVEDARPFAMNYLTEADLRRIWRVARLQRLGLFHGRGCPWLLLHQMSELLDMFFRQAAKEIL